MLLSMNIFKNKLVNTSTSSSYKGNRCYDCWRLTSLSTVYQIYRGDGNGGNLNTLPKPYTSRKAMTNVITFSDTKYISPVLAHEFTPSF